MVQLRGDTGSSLWWWDLWLVRDIRILYLQDTLAITLTGQMRKTKPEEVHFHKVNSACALANKTRVPLTDFTHTPTFLSHSEVWPTQPETLNFTEKGDFSFNQCHF